MELLEFVALVVPLLALAQNTAGPSIHSKSRRRYGATRSQSQAHTYGY